MYGISGLGIITAMISIRIIQKFHIKDSEGNPISIPPKDSSQITRYLVGSTLFGLGWALTGACPGPLFTLTGAGYGIMLVPIASAIAGNAVLREQLPH